MSTVPTPPLPNGPDVQAMALNDADALSRMEEKILPETWELNRWMLASLLALNSAAAATIYPAAVDGGLKRVVCRLFILGAIAALGSGLTLTWVLGRLSRMTSIAQRYWSEIARGGSRDKAMEASIRRNAVAKLWLSSVPQGLLYISAALFVWGIFKL